MSMIEEQEEESDSDSDDEVNPEVAAD